MKYKNKDFVDAQYSKRVHNGITKMLQHSKLAKN